MDRNQVIGFVLIGLLFIVYIQFFAEEPVSPAPIETTQTEVTSDTANTSQYKQPSKANSSISENLQEDSINVNDRDLALFGIFAPLAKGAEAEYVLENEKLKITFNSKGAKIVNVQLKEFKTYEGADLILLDKFNHSISMSLKDSFNRDIDLHSLYYDTELKGNILSFDGNLGNGKSIKITYDLSPDSYTLKYNVSAEGLSNEINSESLTYAWHDRIKHLEHDVEVSRTNASVKYYTALGDFDRIPERTLDFEEESLEEPIKWISIKQKFFVSAIIADNPFSRAKISTNVDPLDDQTVKVADVIASVPKSALSDGSGFTYYFGPNDYDILGKVTEGFEDNIYMGWPPVSLVNIWITLPLFNLLDGVFSNYGLIIIIMVFLIKLVLSPLSYKSYLSMAKMKVLKPELDEIKEKHNGDMAKAQKDQMALYQQVGVNPISGCVPLLLQMPILLALFYFFPQSIHLRQEGFLWATDLSTYDSIATLPFSIPGYGDHVSLFVLLMTASTILYTWSNNQVSTVQGPMKSFSYLMPVIFMFVLNSFPAALSFYYFVSNIVTFGQQALIKRFVNEDKIKVILEENKKKRVNKKKSKFQIRLEDAMKAGEQSKKKK